jgi:phosphoglycerate dehydrogenase-like enzyme
MNTLKIWCNAHFPEALSKHLMDSVTPHEIIWSWSLHKSNLSGGGTDPAARSADIIYGQPHPDDVIQSQTVRWIHLTTAGYTRYDNDAVRNALRSRGAILTNASSVFADPCAEHVLAFMLCHTRYLAPLILNSAAEHQWKILESRAAATLLRGQSALLVGFGAIARRLLELLSPFSMRLATVRRTVRGDESIRAFAIEQLDDALADVDHVINILPSASGTTGIFNASRFARMKRGAIFYNVGRGDTVDQGALCDALESGHVGGAYVDVTTPEPLPPDHRMWSARNCWITPHIAGGHSGELRANVEHFLANFAKFFKGQEMRDRVV